MDPTSDECESWSAVYHQQLFQATGLGTNPEDPLESVKLTNNEEKNEHANRGPTSITAASSSNDASTEVQSIDAHQPRVNNGRPEELIPELVEKAVSRSLETHKNEWRESILSEVTRMIDTKLQAESQAQKVAALEEEVKRLTQENADLKKPKEKTEAPECKLEDTNSARVLTSQADIIELTSESETESPTSSSRPLRRKRRSPVVHESPLPATRANVFPLEPVEGVEATERRFTRGDLCKKIGGSIQTLLVKITNSHGPVGKALGINGYLCPNIHQNPWCPKAPGEHGYMFVGLGDKDRDTFLKEEKQHVFVGQKKGTQKLSMRYVGHYACKRVDPLTLQEWNSLSPDFHDEYAKLTRDKNKDSRTTNEVKADYDKGVLRVPCVQLTCLKYESRLLEGLVSEETSISTPCSSVSVGPPPNGMEAPSPESRGSSSKRPRRQTMKALSQCGDRIYPETPSDCMESGDEGDAEWTTGPNGTKRQRRS
ncbi:hypothetical protein PQX77_000632 [Marasmius sp. AFHP31]|nr:hypothetical protein PQX77_000632 [Marasmius sp. AFHP31]